MTQTFEKIVAKMTPKVGKGKKKKDAVVATEESVTDGEDAVSVKEKAAAEKEAAKLAKAAEKEAAKAAKLAEKEAAKAAKAAGGSTKAKTIEITPEMTAIIEDTQKAKSVKMRQLFDLGMGVGQISAVVFGHYSFVYNTIAAYKAQKQLKQLTEAATPVSTQVEETVEAVEAATAPTEEIEE
jgi:hypothetical protein